MGGCRRQLLPRLAPTGGRQEFLGRPPGSHPQDLSTKAAASLQVAVIIALAIAAVVLAAGTPAAAAPVTELQIPEAPVDEVERLLEGLRRELGADFPGIGLRDLVSLLRGEGDGPDLRSFGSALATYFAKEIVANATLLGRLLALVVLLGLLLALRSSFGDESVAQVAYLLGCIVLAGLAINGLRIAVEAAREHVGLTLDFMRAIMPVLLSLLIGVGAVVTAGLFSPWLLFATYAIASVCNGLVVPMVMVSAACEVVSSLGTQVKVTGVASVLRQVAVTALGLSLTLFLGVMTVQSAAGSVADGVAFRTGKFLASSFLPVIGKMFGDAMEMVVGGSLVLKNAVGIAGGLAVFAMTALPALKIGAVILIYRVAAALAQPVAGREIVACLDGIANCLGVVLLAVCGTGLAWFVSMVMIMGAGNAAVMFR